MTRDEVCTCAQYSQCTVCNKSRSNYEELMAENEQMRETLHLVEAWLNGLTIREALYRATGDESYLLDLPRWAREVARGEQPAQEVEE